MSPTLQLDPDEIGRAISPLARRIDELTGLSRGIWRKRMILHGASGEPR